MAAIDGRPDRLQRAYEHLDGAYKALIEERAITEPRRLLEELNERGLPNDVLELAGLIWSIRQLRDTVEKLVRKTKGEEEEDRGPAVVEG